MENNITQPENEEFWKNAEKSHKRGKFFGGFLIVTIGSLFLAKELGADIPQWVFTWKMLLIGMGLMIGVKHGFLHPGWLCLILIGGAFILTDIYPGIAIKPILWPSLIIIFGLFIMFKPRRKFKQRHWEKLHDRYHRHHRHRHHHDSPFDCGMDKPGTDSSDDYIDSTAFMAGVKKNILSKNWKGGDITNIFGGTELNLTQADFEKSATLDLTNVFGGTKLLIPANWEINSDLVSVFGNIEDKRPIQPTSNNENAKVLILKGTTFMGGIEIKSY